MALVLGCGVLVLVVEVGCEIGGLLLRCLCVCTVLNLVENDRSCGLTLLK